MDDGKKMVFGIRNVLQRFGYVNLLPVHRARVPVVKFVVPPQMVRHHGALRHASHLVDTVSCLYICDAWQVRDGVEPIQCDVCVNNTAAVYNTSLLAAYMRLDWRARALVLLVKASRHHPPASSDPAAC